jgi:hypothetical protein
LVLAGGFDVTVYARYLGVGRVELEVHGAEQETVAFLQAIQLRHLRPHITRWTVLSAEFSPGRKGFSIR